MRSIVRAVSAEGVLATIEDIRAQEVVGGFPPVPVRLVSVVAALITEGLLEVPEVPSVPGKEVGLDSINMLVLLQGENVERELVILTVP